MTETRVSYAPPGGGVQRYGVAREPPSSGKFFGQTVLVTGGGGIVGHSLIARILREGGSVIAPVRTQRSSDKLRGMLRDEPLQRLRIVVGDYTTASGAHTLVTWLNTRAQAGLDHVVSIHGGRHTSAKLTDVRGGDFKETCNAHVLPHIIIAQACMPHLLDRPASSYSIVTGRLGEQCLKVDEALLCIANAATYGVAAALKAEAAHARVAARVNEMRIGAVIRRDDAADNPAFPGWHALPSSKLANVIVQHMCGDVDQAVIHISERDIERAPEERYAAEEPAREGAPSPRRVGEAFTAAREREPAAVGPVKLVTVPALGEREGREGERYGGGSRETRFVQGGEREERYLEQRERYGGGEAGRERYEEREPAEREGVASKAAGLMERVGERMGLTSHKET